MAIITSDKHARLFGYYQAGDLASELEKRQKIKDGVHAAMPRNRAERRRMIAIIKGEMK